jgi:hypothetical protein
VHSVIEQQARRQRFLAVRQAHAASSTDSDYDEITAAWDEASEDGLADGRPAPRVAPAGELPPEVFQR